MSTFTRDTSAPIRENILRSLQCRFQNILKDQDGYTETWRFVLRSPLSERHTDFGSSIAILDARESKAREVQYMRCTLPLSIEFWTRLAETEMASMELNRLLGDIQRSLHSDIYTDGLTLNIEETGSEIDIEGQGDMLVGGVLFVNVLYRHRVDDPRKLHGET